MSETEREDLEESEKVQHWVERLCQTRLEQISSVENESPEVKSIKFHSSILMCVGLLVHSLLVQSSKQLKCTSRCLQPVLLHRLVPPDGGSLEA